MRITSRQSSSCSLDPALEGLRGQGFASPSDGELARLAPWLRLAPALSGLVALVGTLLQAPTLLLGLAVALAACAVGPHHPVDFLYVLVARRFTGGPCLPRNPPARRFACAVACVWALSVAGLLASGLTTAATVVGVAFALTAQVPATSGFCPGAWLYWRAVSGER